MVLGLRKKMSRITAYNNTDPNKKPVVSLATLVAMFVRIRGSPL
jgi:hypothetical protein